MEDWKSVGHKDCFTPKSLQVLIHNVSMLCSVKHIVEIGGLPPVDWEQLMLKRIGKEPILRLLFVIYQQTEQVDIMLDELLAYNPAEWYQAKEDCDIMGYYSKYPFAQFQPE